MQDTAHSVLRCCKQSLDLPKPPVMRILYATPASFSDGGRYNNLDAALRHALDMQAAGASIVDIGGESTRPGAAPVSVQQELDRVAPVGERISQETERNSSVGASSPEDLIEEASCGA